MTALPTTPKFIDYDAVYLPKNHFLKEESMETQTYLDLFYPFKKLDFRKDGEKSEWERQSRPQCRPQGAGAYDDFSNRADGNGDVFTARIRRTV
jgi:hypothetical protein